MDGTLIDSEPIWIGQERELMNSLGAAWSEADAIHCIGGPMSRVDAYMRSKLTLEQQSEYAPMELTSNLLARMEVQLAKGVDFAPGARELLEALFGLGIPMGLVSASSRKLVDAALNSVGGKYFQVTISNDDVMRSKPDPEGYLKAANHLCVDIEQTLILEDSVTGVTAAMNSGAYVVGIDHVAQLPTGAKVVHTKTLESVSISNLVKLFAGVGR